jgi:GH24 family phage-related lysozyme (muramidase)
LLSYKLDRVYLPAIRKIPYSGEWSPDMVSAILSFAYNLGAGFYNPNSDGFRQLSTALRDKRWSQVPSKLLLYDKALENGKLQALPGLTKRRKEEGALWKKGLSQISYSYT